MIASSEETFTVSTSISKADIPMTILLEKNSQENHPKLEQVFSVLLSWQGIRK